MFAARTVVGARPAAVAPSTRARRAPASVVATSRASIAAARAVGAPRASPVRANARASPVTAAGESFLAPMRALLRARARRVTGGRILSVTTRAIGDAASGVPAPVPSASGAPKQSVWTGRAYLIFVAAAYGSLSVAFKYVYSLPGPPSAGVIGAVRGVFAALCFIPMILKERRRAANAEATDADALGDPNVFWKAAGELALWNLVAQGACNVALLFTDATRVSFLTQASIAFTPVLVSVTGDRVAPITWVGCALAIAGVVLLGFDGGGSAAAGAAAGGLNVGDIIALIGAASYSLYIFRISAFAKKGLPGNLTQAWKTVILSVLYLGWAAADLVRHLQAPAAVAAPWAGWANPLAWAVLIFTAVVPGYFADVCQAKGQESVSPSESQVLLAGEPLFAAVMGAFLLGESLGTYGYVGGAGLVAGAILAGLDDGGAEEGEDVAGDVAEKTA